VEKNFSTRVQASAPVIPGPHPPGVINPGRSLYPSSWRAAADIPLGGTPPIKSSPEQNRKPHGFNRLGAHGCQSWRFSPRGRVLGPSVSLGRWELRNQPGGSQMQPPVVPTNVVGPCIPRLESQSFAKANTFFCTLLSNLTGANFRLLL